MGVKYCKGCGREKKIDQFTIDRRRSDGYYSKCRSCQKRMREMSAVIAAMMERKRSARVDEEKITYDAVVKAERLAIEAPRVLGVQSIEVTQMIALTEDYYLIKR